MNPFFRLLERAVTRFNQASLWRGQCTVWGQTMTAGTFERWLYLRLHRLGRMGRDERETLGRIIRPGMTVLDIGSNLGLYTVLLSKLAGPDGRIISFEPDPELFASLTRNCALNHCPNVEAHNLAVGRQRGRLSLQKLVFNTGDNHLGGKSGSLFRQSVETTVVALDDFLPEMRPDLVKIDVQGWELEVLKGMDSLLQRSPQTDLYLELWPQGLQRAGNSAAEMAGWLKERGFHLYRAGDWKLLDDPAFSTLSLELTGLKHADLFATRGVLADGRVSR